MQRILVDAVRELLGRETGIDARSDSHILRPIIGAIRLSELAALRTCVFKEHEGLTF